ncbi:MAG: DNA-binding transcriptional regulator YiaG, partial [Saprospiraceae bacterium]
MRSKDRKAARKSIDRKLRPLSHDYGLARPPKGWLKAIRESLGMTTSQFAKRNGVSQSRAVEIEKSEVSGSLTIDS